MQRLASFTAYAIVFILLLPLLITVFLSVFDLALWDGTYSYLVGPVKESLSTMLSVAMWLAIVDCCTGQNNNIVAFNSDDRLVTKNNLLTTTRTTTFHLFFPAIAIVIIFFFHITTDLCGNSTIITSLKHLVIFLFYLSATTFVIISNLNNSNPKGDLTKKEDGRLIAFLVYAEKLVRYAYFPLLIAALLAFVERTLFEGQRSAETYEVVQGWILSLLILTALFTILRDASDTEEEQSD